MWIVEDVRGKYHVIPVANYAAEGNFYVWKLADGNLIRFHMDQIIGMWPMGSVKELPPTA